MARRTRRPHFNPADIPEMVESMRKTRNFVLRYGQSMDFGTDARRRCDAVSDAIDRLAEHLTGDLTLFHAKPHDPVRRVR